MIFRSDSFDLVVCGGGLAGICAALSAARQGLRTCLVQDRPVLGGNASSEVRVTVHGSACFHAYAREGGILNELLTEERARNHEFINENGWTNSVFDLVLYDACQREPNLTVMVNSTVIDVELGSEISGLARTAQRPPASDAAGYWSRPACAEADRIVAVLVRVANAETQVRLVAPLFVDATGDAVVADLAGCAWRMGSEGLAETAETHAPAEASRDTMGNSIHLRARDIGREAPFVPPDWAVQQRDPAYFYEQGRKPSDPRGGFWWIEIGMPWHTIHDAETIRHQLTRHALGVWDWMKNHDPVMRERCRNFALDWIGQVPGKRESRRVVGLHWLTEHDLQSNVRFADEVAYGGWFVDLHTPGGLLADKSEPAAAEHYRNDSEYAAKSYIGPYGIPLRSLIARDVRNLFLAGRDISCTHAALGTVRVMGTTALMGQAVGTAAAHAHRAGGDAHGSVVLIGAIQQRLLRDGCFLPHVSDPGDNDHARRARASASSVAAVSANHEEDSWISGGLGGPGLTYRTRTEPVDLTKAQAQWIACAGGRIDQVRLCVESAAAVRLPLRLRRADGIWDYRRTTPTLAEADVLVPAGRSWITLPVGLSEVPAGWVRLEAGPCPGARWVLGGGMAPGHVSAEQLSPSKWRGRTDGSQLSFAIEPAQVVWSAEQAINGVDRPHLQANAWRSNPAQPLPQWLELAWDEPRKIAAVELGFAGNLRSEIHLYPPFWRDPQCVRDYRILIDPGVGQWQEILHITGNYQRLRQHRLEAAVSAQRLRLVVEATNGDPSATVYVVRCLAG